MHSYNRHENNRILIIDDNPAIHADFRKILSATQIDDDFLTDVAEIFGQPTAASNKQRFELDSAYQGQEGLRMVEAAAAEGRPYALAFVDVRMPPGWDGVETITRIWKSCPDLQIVICTAYSDHSWEEIINQVGKAESLLILKKPFDNVEVLQLAHALTNKWELNHEIQARLMHLETRVGERTKELEQANTKLRNEAAEREEVQRALLRSEERFSKAFKASPVPITIHSVASGRYLDVNDSFLAMTGYDRSEIIERSAEVLGLSLAATAPVTQPSGKPVRNVSGSIRTKAGECREILLSTELLTLSEETCVLTLLVDVTEQRLLETKLRHSQKLESIGQLAAGIAHNFNNILGVILGHSSLRLHTHGSETDVEKSFEEISKASERGASLVGQLLAAGQQQKQSDEPVDLNTVIAHTATLLRPLLGKQIELDCQESADLPLILADVSNLDQVLMNLILNARDAMPSGGRIVVAATAAAVSAREAENHPHAKPGDFVRLTVRDSGLGMAPATLERIFEPFFTTKEVGLGSGLGLATVRGTVAQLGGWIEVQSECGVGTQFDAYFPICSRLAKAVVATAEVKMTAHSGETVLLVEDEPALQRIVTMTLKANGYRVLVADDAPHALDLWTKNSDSVDLLLTDLTMPGGITGYELAQQLRSTRPDLPVIFSSGFAPNLGFDICKSATFLPKPYTVKHVLQAVRSSLDAA
jgi:two-component system cell cycle sensor histidine kinase/response regulator CckA